MVDDRRIGVTQPRRVHRVLDDAPGFSRRIGASSRTRRTLPFSDGRIISMCLRTFHGRLDDRSAVGVTAWRAGLDRPAIVDDGRELFGSFQHNVALPRICREILDASYR